MIDRDVEPQRRFGQDVGGVRPAGHVPRGLLDRGVARLRPKDDAHRRDRRPHDFAPGET